MILNRAKHVSLCVCRAEADATPHRRRRNVVCRLRCGWRCEKDEVNVGVVFCCCFGSRLYNMHFDAHHQILAILTCVNAYIIENYAAQREMFARYY